jgi:hypothetical protein
MTDRPDIRRDLRPPLQPYVSASGIVAIRLPGDTCPVVYVPTIHDPLIKADRERMERAAARLIVFEDYDHQFDDLRDEVAD